ncbi:MAG: EAL domain-containing protein [Pseudomonadota bacterium]|nr:EAL domain-containing protein [Pseudomonadota bacterium]
MPATLAGVPLDRLILEITEHETVAHYSRLNRALDPMRSQGLRVAVDDMGAGYSSLRHILQIRPDLIKLDMSLCSGIDKDPARRALASALISFSREIDSQLVAEGVETEEERDVLRSLGVNLVQGFCWDGRPRRPLRQTLASCQRRVRIEGRERTAKAPLAMSLRGA